MIAYCKIYPKDISIVDHVEIDVHDLQVRTVEIIAISTANAKYGITGWDYIEIPLLSGNNHIVINPEIRS